MFEGEVKNLFQSITGQLIPKSDGLHNHVKTFLNQEIKGIFKKK
jgi:hypothetical protein